MATLRIQACDTGSHLLRSGGDNGAWKRVNAVAILTLCRCNYAQLVSAWAAHGQTMPESIEPECLLRIVLCVCARIVQLQYSQERNVVGVAVKDNTGDGG